MPDPPRIARERAFNSRLGCCGCLIQSPRVHLGKAWPEGMLKSKFGCCERQHGHLPLGLHPASMLASSDDLFNLIQCTDCSVYSCIVRPKAMVGIDCCADTIHPPVLPRYFSQHLGQALAIHCFNGGWAGKTHFSAKVFSLFSVTFCLLSFLGVCLALALHRQ